MGQTMRDDADPAGAVLSRTAAQRFLTTLPGSRISRHLLQATQTALNPSRQMNRNAGTATNATRSHASPLRQDVANLPYPVVNIAEVKVPSDNPSNQVGVPIFQ